VALHPRDVSRHAEQWTRALKSGEAYSIDLRIRGADGVHRWHLARALPVRDQAGQFSRWLGTFTDIDDQKRAEGSLAFLAGASAALASSLDYETTLTSVARLAVPHVADWCIIDMVEPNGNLRRLAVAHADASKAEVARELARRSPGDPDAPFGPSRVLRTGRAELEAEITDAMLVASARDDKHLAALRRVRVVSSICAPLVARGRTLGAITLAMAESGRRYGTGDLPLAEDLARRAAVAVDNARLHRQAHDALREAEAANRAKNEFLAVLSHELRTPLTPVLASASAMLDDPDTPPEVRPTLEMTRRNIELEARLIDDLLDVTRISQGKLRLAPEVVDAHALLLRAVSICRNDVHSGGLRLELDLTASRRHVKADPARLQQVFWNLIKNAVKFTPSGGTITVSSRNEEEPGRFLVAVADSGIGIEPDVLPKIFDAFEQGEASTQRRFGGLGLGLAICRSVVEAHGGHLTAASAGRGRGATFTIDLETTTEAPPTEPAAPEPRPAPARRPLRILLVEDNQDTLQVMARLLRRRGYEVEEAGSLARALAAAQESEFDLVVSDIGLPDGSGLELIRELRAQRPIKAIALSGFGRDDDLRQSEEAGFVAHLTKPVDFPRLEALIQQVAAAGAGRSGLT
jgi:signal transduction histidine kinase